jgi:hypothetical protein
MMNPSSFLIMLFLATVTISCNTTADPDTTWNNTKLNTIRVSIDGSEVVLTATAKRQTTGGKTILSVDAADQSGNPVLGFTFTDVTAGIHFFGEPEVFMYYEIKNGSETIRYESTTTGGSITIAELGTSTLKAIFIATLSKTSGTGGGTTVKMTDGNLNLTVQ